MNLTVAPTAEQLRHLLASGNDRAGNHVLWVDAAGEVHLTRLPADVTPSGFQEAHPEMRLRYEAFEKGNEYVGPEAAEDAEWVAQLFDSLLSEWREAEGKAAVTFVDLDRLPAPTTYRQGP